MAAESRSARHQLSNEYSGARAGAGRYESHPIHGSLVRHTLTLGVERHVIALEITVCLAVVLGVGLSVSALCLVAVVALAIHPTLAWATARDPLATEVYVRSRSYADYYAPHATAHAALHTHVPRPRASLPKVR